MKSCFVFFLAFKRKIMSSFHKILNSMFTLQGCLIFVNRKVINPIITIVKKHFLVFIKEAHKWDRTKLTIFSFTHPTIVDQKRKNKPLPSISGISIDNFPIAAYTHMYKSRKPTTKVFPRCLTSMTT